MIIRKCKTCSRWPCKCGLRADPAIALKRAARAFVPAVVAVFMAGAVGAQVPQIECGMRDAFLRRLAQNDHQGVAGRGLSSNGQLIEFTVSPNGGWTILITSPAGFSCIAATGTGWEAVKDVLGVPG